MTPLALPAASRGCKVMFRKAKGCTARSGLVRRVDRDGTIIVTSRGKYVSVAPMQLVSITVPKEVEA